jgi:hypothetical protein
MTYTALAVVQLPVMETREVHPGIEAQIPTGESIRKEPGDKITKAELSEAGQTDEDIKRLLKDKAMEEN